MSLTNKLRISMFAAAFGFQMLYMSWASTDSGYPSVLELRMSMGAALGLGYLALACALCAITLASDSRWLLGITAGACALIYASDSAYMGHWQERFWLLLAIYALLLVVLGQEFIWITGLIVGTILLYLATVLLDVLSIPLDAIGWTRRKLRGEDSTATAYGHG
jgi:hypothetical protein